MSQGLTDSIAQGQDEAAALIEPTSGVSLAYGELLESIDRMARQLRTAGIGRGSRVGLLAGNGPEVIAAFLGVASVGAAAAPINPALTPVEVDAICEDLALAAILVDQAESRVAVNDVFAAREIPLFALARAPRVGLVDVEPARGQGPETHADDVCLLLQTSGTTSRPKLVPLRQRNLMASATNIAQFYELGSADSAYCVMPLFHIHGLVGVTVSTLVSGGTVVVPRRILPSRIGDDLAAHQVTWLSAVPTVMGRLLPRLDRERAADLRFGRTSSSALPPDMIDSFESRLEVPLVEAYGMTEAAHQMTSNPLPPGERRAGTVGTGTGTQVAILDEDLSELEPGRRGEVAVRGPGVIDGYLDNPEANADAFTNGWFRTGDVGTVSEDGYLTLVGRTTELINRAGEKIAPREIDEVLLSHPAVVEATAFAAQNAKYGEAVQAAVVIDGDVDSRTLIKHCGLSLAAFKVPVRVFIVDEIPKGPTGKVQRSSLADSLGQ